MSQRRLLEFLSAAAAGSLMTFSVAAGNDASSPVYGVTLPADYRQWQVVSAAHEAGNLNDIRVIVGNSLAMEAFREGRRPFPDGAMIARIAWRLEASARNNAIFGRPQSFVAATPTNVQIEEKDSKRFASTGGWGFGQFENGQANQDKTLITSCFECHKKLPAREDFIFTSYAR